MQATKTFASYSPAEVALRYLADPTPPSEAVREDFDAAIGFIDVSGFTALSEKLAKEAGDAGAELLNLYINQYFEKLIKEVSNYNGDVIKFAGDALQVIWRNRPNEPQESLAELVIRASRCCLAMLAKHSNFKPRTTDGAVLEGIVLKLHMGVGAGRISSFIVGGHGPSLDEKKWEYFIAGEPIQQAPRLPLLPPNPPT
jgi:class 3 adenylate cyclase